MLRAKDRLKSVIVSLIYAVSRIPRVPNENRRNISIYFSQILNKYNRRHDIWEHDLGNLSGVKPPSGKRKNYSGKYSH